MLHAKAQLLVSVLVFLVAGASQPVRSQSIEDPARLMPEWALAYLEITHPEQLIEPAFKPAVWERLSGTKEVKAYLASEKYGQAQSAVAAIEAKVGLKWDQLLRNHSRSLHVAFDPIGNGLVLIVRARQAGDWPKLNSAALELIAADAARNGRPSPLQNKEYRGYTAYTLGSNVSYVIAGELLIASNKPEILKSVLDRVKDGGRSLIDSADYQQSRSAVPSGQAAWSMLRLTPLRLFPKFGQVVSGKSNNPAAELIAGGVLDALRHADVVTSSVHLDASGLRWRTALPHDAVRRSKSRAWFFEAEPGQAAPAPLEPKGVLATITTYRDLAGLWAMRDELFDEATAAKLIQADTNLGLFFAGRDFGTQVLGEFTPRWQFIVARQQYSASAPVPAVKLPAAALVLELKNPEHFGPNLVLAFQKIVGTINLVGGQQGQPQLLLTSEQYHDVAISKATYLTDSGSKAKDAAIYFNASPACACVGKHFVVGSTIGIVRELVDLLRQPESSQVTRENLCWQLDVQQVVAALADNLPSLISQNMLEEGTDREQSEQNVNNLLSLLRLVSRASLRLAVEERALVLEAEIRSDAPMTVVPALR